MEIKKKWYQSNVAIIALLIFFFPVGLFLMWKYAGWNKVVKIVVTGFYTLIVIGAIATPSSNTSTSNTPTPQAQIDTNTNSEAKAPEPTKEVKPMSTSDKLWVALDNSMKTRKDFSVGYDEPTKTASITKTELSAWDESSLVRDSFTTLVKYGKEAFKVDGVDEVQVVFKTEFTDQYGKKDTSDAVRIIMTKEEFNKFEWDNLKYQSVYEPIKKSAEGFYIHPAILKNLKYDKLYLTI